MMDRTRIGAATEVLLIIVDCPTVPRASGPKLISCLHQPKVSELGPGSSNGDRTKGLGPICRCEKDKE